MPSQDEVTDAIVTANGIKVFTRRQSLSSAFTSAIIDARASHKSVPLAGQARGTRQRDGWPKLAYPEHSTIV